MSDYRNILRRILVIGTFIFFCQNFASADNGQNEFVVPAKLRPRVDFWRSIFTKYGKYQKVIHHRRYPQIAFKVLDFSKASQEMSPSSFDSFVESVETKKVEEIKESFRQLAVSGVPKDSMQQYIVEQMKSLPGGKQKYQDMLDNQDWVRTQTGISEKCEDAVQRSGRYLPYIERIFTGEYSLPKELTRLPFIESSFNYTAYSSVGASGIWQFMPATAKKFMTVSALVDERLDPFISSRAAAQYLGRAYKSLGNWGLAITSYNNGVAGVYKKVKEEGTSDIVRLIEKTSGDPVFGFASQNFWPEFLAAVEIMQNPKKYYPKINIYPALEFKEYRIPHPMTLNESARVTGVSIDDILNANYAILKPVALGKRPLPTGYVLKIPTNSKSNMPVEYGPRIPEKALTQKKSIKLPVSKGKSKVIKKQKNTSKARIITVKSGQTLSQIANIYGISVAKLKHLNGLKSNEIHPGKKIKVQ